MRGRSETNITENKHWGVKRSVPFICMICFFFFFFFNKLSTNKYISPSEYKFELKVYNLIALQAKRPSSLNGKMLNSAIGKQGKKITSDKMQQFRCNKNK